MKKIILFVIFSFLLVSCEYSIDYYFEIDNQLSEDIRVVIASDGDPESLNFAKEVDMIIPSWEKERVFSYWGGVGGVRLKQMTLIHQMLYFLQLNLFKFILVKI